MSFLYLFSFYAYITSLLFLLMTFEGIIEFPSLWHESILGGTTIIRCIVIPILCNTQMMRHIENSKMSTRITIIIHGIHIHTMYIICTCVSYYSRVQRQEWRDYWIKRIHVTNFYRISPPLARIRYSTTLLYYNTFGFGLKSLSDTLCTLWERRMTFGRVKWNEGMWAF